VPGLKDGVIEIDANHLASHQRMKQVRKIQCAAAFSVSDFDNDFWASLVNDLLICSGIQQHLSRLHFHPGNLVENNLLVMADNPISQIPNPPAAVAAIRRVQRGSGFLRVLAEQFEIPRQGLALLLVKGKVLAVVAFATTCGERPLGH
jgi:hypothetical protein